MKVGNFMIPLEKIITINENDTIANAAELILSGHIGSLLVVKKRGDDTPLACGLITKTDLLRFYMNHIDEKDSIGKHLKKKFCLVYEDEDRNKVAEEMVKNGFHHILVANKSREIVGLISSLDLAREFYEDSKDVWRKLFGIPKGEVKDKIEEFLWKLDRLLPDPDADTYLLGP